MCVWRGSGERVEREWRESVCVDREWREREKREGRERGEREEREREKRDAYSSIPKARNKHGAANGAVQRMGHIVTVPGRGHAKSGGNPPIEMTPTQRPKLSGFNSQNPAYVAVAVTIAAVLFGVAIICWESGAIQVGLKRRGRADQLVRAQHAVDVGVRRTEERVDPHREDGPDGGGRRWQP